MARGTVGSGSCAWLVPGEYNCSSTGDSGTDGMSSDGMSSDCPNVPGVAYGPAVGGLAIGRRTRGATRPPAPGRQVVPDEASAKKDNVTSERQQRSRRPFKHSVLLPEARERSEFEDEVLPER